MEHLKKLQELHKKEQKLLQRFESHFNNQESEPSTPSEATARQSSTSSRDVNELREELMKLKNARDTSTLLFVCSLQPQVIKLSSTISDTALLNKLVSPPLRITLNRQVLALKDAIYFVKMSVSEVLSESDQPKSEKNCGSSTSSSTVSPPLGLHHQPAKSLHVKGDTVISFHLPKTSLVFDGVVIASLPQISTDAFDKNYCYTFSLHLQRSLDINDDGGEFSSSTNAVETLCVIHSTPWKAQLYSDLEPSVRHIPFPTTSALPSHASSLIDPSRSLYPRNENWALAYQHQQQQNAADQQSLYAFASKAYEESLGQPPSFPHHQSDYNNDGGQFGQTTTTTTTANTPFLRSRQRSLRAAHSLGKSSSSDNLPAATRRQTKQRASRKRRMEQDYYQIDITDLLVLPQKEAAERLGISESMLCKRFKECTRRKWPYRYLRKIDKIIVMLRMSEKSGKIPPEDLQKLQRLLREREKCLEPVTIRIARNDKMYARRYNIAKRNKQRKKLQAAAKAAEAVNVALPPPSSSQFSNSSSSSSSSGTAATSYTQLQPIQSILPHPQQSISRPIHPDAADTLLQLGKNPQIMVPGVNQLRPMKSAPAVMKEYANTNWWVPSGRYPPNLSTLRSDEATTTTSSIQQQQPHSSSYQQQ